MTMPHGTLREARILIVDDQEANVRVLHRILHKAEGLVDQDAAIVAADSPNDLHLRFKGLL
jgi:CheY-like chemotaxis protein